MSNKKRQKNTDLDTIFSKINNEINDEEICFNINNQENIMDNTDNTKYQYYNNNNPFNMTNNNFDEAEENEQFDETIVVFQEEKTSNVNDDVITKNSTNEKEEELSTNKENNKENLSNNGVMSRNEVVKTHGKKKKKKKKKEKNGKIEIFAHDKNKQKQVKLDLKQIEKKQNKAKKIFLKKLTNPHSLRSKSLSSSVKQIEGNIAGGSVELPPSKIIYEKGVSDDEEEIQNIIKKKKRKKTNLKPIVTPYLLSIKEKEDYNNRLQKIRQQFTEKKFVNEPKTFYYVLKPGNGSSLVKFSLKHRINWKEAQMNVTSLFNFKWQTSTLCIDYKNLSSIESIPQIVNHFEYHNTISNKSNLFLNLFEYCENNNINIWKYVPFTVFINPNNENEKNFDILYDNISKYIINHNDIDKTLNINKKPKEKEKEDNYYSNLFRTMECKVFGRRKDVPKDTWMMGSRTPIQISDNHYDGKNLWVLKASNLNRGQCIRLLDSKELFHEIIKEWRQGINLKGVNKGTTDNNIQIKINNDNNNQNKGEEIPPSDTYITERIIVQKYIEKPLCYYGRKCDMRIWVLLTHEMKIYIYKEGHLKTCSEKYDINNKKDAYVHITNYSFQKHCLNFQKFELGNEVPFHDFQKYLDTEYKDQKVNVRDHIMNQVKYIVELSIKAVKDKINPNKRNFCFEIFGYDFMMDTNLNVYLLEINSNPGLEISSPWIKAIVPRMIDDALRLTIDEVFPTKYIFDKNWKKQTNYEDYSNDLTNKNVGVKKESEGRRIVKKKVYVDICDQGSGTQDKIDEKYFQENLRQKEVKIHKKITDKNNTNKKEITKNNENNFNININKDNTSNNTSNNNDNDNANVPNKKEKEVKEVKEEETEKKFDQKNYISPFPVPGYEPWENLWEFICELKEEKQENYIPGIRGLLEIQKKRQTASAPTNLNNNKRNNMKNNINNKEKEKEKENKKKEKINNNIINKDVKKNKNEQNKKKNEKKEIIRKKGFENNDLKECLKEFKKRDNIKEEEKNGNIANDPVDDKKSENNIVETNNEEVKQEKEFEEPQVDVKDDNKDSNN